MILLVDDPTRVARIVLDAPPVNALSVAVLEETATTLAAQKNVAVLVVESAIAKYFSAGADLKHLAHCDGLGFAAYLDLLNRVLDAIAALECPTIAVVDGAALGGGMELALACDLRFASPRATFGLPEINLGLFPGAGGTQRLPRLAGQALALDLLLSGRVLDGTAAHGCGVVQYLESDPRAAADVLAASMARSPVACTAIKRCVKGADGPLADGLRLERRELLEVFSGPGGREGIEAFLARRAETAR